MMNKSDSIKELATALAKAQGQFAGAAKDSVNPHFKSKYADLESVVSAIKEPLSKNGLSFIQVAHDTQFTAAIETIIMHASGEWLSAGVVSVSVSKNDAQGYGSAMTYARRYSLSAAFGIAPEDDDGNAASKAPARQEPVRMEAVRNFNPETAKLTAYTDEQLDANFDAWQAAINSGKSTPQRILAMVSTKFKLSDSQAETIRNMKKEEAIMNAAEGVQA